jgi:raffinose/stachyose/melibiose transport system substrate-binding protein
MTAQIMKKRFLIVAITGLLLLGSAPAWSEETVVRMLHIEDDQEKVALWQQIARDYEAQHANVRIELSHMDNQSFKVWLPALLKSSERPNIIHSWGGGVFQELVEAGQLKDISAQMRGEWEETLDPKGLAAFTTPEGAVYGAPLKVDLQVIWYNKALFEKAGIKASDIKSYGDFLEAVKKLKAAGITPIALGGADQWPLHFYWTMLALRLGGKEAFEAAYNRTGEGFDSPAFVKAAEMFKELVDLKPFQPDFLRANYRDAAAYFGDGKAAMHFQGPYDCINQRLFSSNGKGIPEEQLDYFAFPMVEGGKGNSGDTLGAIVGWLVTKDSPDQAVDFLRFFVNKDHQTEMAQRNMHIPTTKGSAEALQNPVLKRIAEDFARSPYLQIVYDQMLGRGGGIMVNELSAALAAGSISPEEAARNLQEEWQLK